MINTELHNGDCLEYMKKIPTSSIDLIITDPPYNLGKFMEERDTNLVKMRDNFFGAAGWDDFLKYPQIDINIAFDHKDDTPDYKIVKSL